MSDKTDKTKFSTNFLIGFFAIPFLSLYTVKIGTSPIYFFLILATVMCFIKFFFTKKMYLSIDVIVLFLISIYAFLISSFEINGPNVSLFFGASVFYIVKSLKGKLHYAYFLKLVDLLFLISLILILLDTIFRFQSPIELESAIEHYRSQNTLFYIYKFNSIMFSDSNLTGIITLSLSCLSLFLRKHLKSKRYLIYTFLFSILLLLSFSRSAIFAFLIICCYIYYKNINSPYLRFAILSFIIISCISIFIPYFLHDESFLSKIYIYELFLNHFHQANISSIFFGLSLGGFGKTYGIEAHSIYATYICELGIIGAVAFFIFLKSVISKSGDVLVYSIFPILIPGLSYYPYAGIPMTFFSIAAILFLEDILVNERK